jgi:DNA-binding NtrC family response regulator
VSSKKKIISIVDDDKDISNLFRIALSEMIAGYDFFSFNDSLSALEHFTENQSAYSMVITDLRMASLNGLELLKKIKNGNPNVRTILISGFNAENQMFRDYMELGIVDSTIEKPVRIQTLCNKVKSELQIYQLENPM